MVVGRWVVICVMCGGYWRGGGQTWKDTFHGHTVQFWLIKVRRLVSACTVSWRDSHSCMCCSFCDLSYLMFVIVGWQPMVQFVVEHELYFLRYYCVGPVKGIVDGVYAGGSLELFVSAVLFDYYRDPPFVLYWMEICMHIVVLTVLMLCVRVAEAGVIVGLSFCSGWHTN